MMNAFFAAKNGDRNPLLATIVFLPPFLVIGLNFAYMDMTTVILFYVMIVVLLS